jgi:hypothetical protein
MTPRERAAEMLLKELKGGSEDQWFYISVVYVPTNTFQHGLIIPGRGPTDAWGRMHHLNLCPPDCETQTCGPIPSDIMKQIPKERRLRKLTKEESLSLGNGEAFEEY